MNYSKRIKNLQMMMRDVLDVEALLITDGFNLNYLVGFTGGGSDGAVLVSLDKAGLITDGRYTEAYQNNLPEGVEFFETREYYDKVVELTQQWNIEKLGFEENIPFSIFDRIDTALEIDFVPTPSPVEALREIKDDDEVAAIQVAIDKSITAYELLLKQIEIGMTEKQVVNLLDTIARQQGLQKASFDTIVASGINSSKPHATATDRKLQNGDFVTIDWGYYLNGYTSDLTRTFGIGDVDDKLKNIYQIVLDAQQKQVAAVKPDMPMNQLDAIGRDLITDAGFGKEFNHGTGHGFGLNIHETPYIQNRFDNPTVVGNIITIEPGIYVSGLGGVRIEDDLLVTKTGRDVLTGKLAKELIIL